MNLADPNDYKKFYSHKFNKAALRYELAVSVFDNKLISMNGPFPAAKNDAAIYKEGLLGKLTDQEKVIADRGYRGCPKASTPNGYDNIELRKFKTRARQRHETFNGRIKAFQCLANPFRQHFSLEKHQSVFEAVCVIVQYKLEHGSPLFDA